MTQRHFYTASDAETIASAVNRLVVCLSCTYLRSGMNLMQNFVSGERKVAERWSFPFSSFPMLPLSFALPYVSPFSCCKMAPQIQCCTKRGAFRGACHHWRPNLPGGCCSCLEQSAGVSTGIAVTASFSQQTEDRAFCPVVQLV